MLVENEADDLIKMLKLTNLSTKLKLTTLIKDLKKFESYAREVELIEF
jgi:hypothetical protein